MRTISEEDNAKLQNCITKAFPPHRREECAVCGQHGSWDISGPLVIKRYMEPNGHTYKEAEKEAVVPIIAVVHECGNTILFSAVTIGFIDQKTGKIVSQTQRGII